MLEHGKALRLAIEHLAVINPLFARYANMSDTWTNVDACLALLEPFEEATRALSGEKYATIALYYTMQHLAPSG